eukprot:CAMPEP_0180284932 /NCGR_PEP_ID=MMETSP0988-20121125/11578_1 /TAXON_ID=697907 /ORGANISM="non described non described, Strain CCMP2293" /LENGTH=124 /DNA_ID=CAMNT_0022258175 /DNA_START=153 /DNA_END=527 /DNA_ORIENTATION=-
MTVTSRPLASSAQPPYREEALPWKSLIGTGASASRIASITCSKEAPIKFFPATSTICDAGCTPAFSALEPCETPVITTPITLSWFSSRTMPMGLSSAKSLNSRENLRPSSPLENAGGSYLHVGL